MREEAVHFVPERSIRDRASAAFARERAHLAVLLPGADVQHVGSTAVPGSLTKGDLDLQVRVRADALGRAEAVLALRYGRNAGNAHGPELASFVRHAPGELPLGVQLTAIDGSYDDFWRFRDLLRGRSDLRLRYDLLKLRYEGQPMGAYRAAKGRLFASLLPLLPRGGAPAPA